MNALEAAFEQLTVAGILLVEDVRLAAANFSYLIISIPVNRAMFTGEDAPTMLVRGGGEEGGDSFIQVWPSQVHVSLRKLPSQQEAPPRTERPRPGRRRKSCPCRHGATEISSPRRAGSSRPR